MKNDPGQRQPSISKIHEATRDSASADWLIVFAGMDPLCDLPCPESLRIFKTWGASVVARDTGAAQGFRLPNEAQPALREGCATDRREGFQGSAAAEPYPEPRRQSPESNALVNPSCARRAMNLATKELLGGRLVVVIEKRFTS